MTNADIPFRRKGKLTERITVCVDEDIKRAYAAAIAAGVDAAELIRRYMKQELSAIIEAAKKAS